MQQIKALTRDFLFHVSLIILLFLYQPAACRSIPLCACCGRQPNMSGKKRTVYFAVNNNKNYYYTLSVLSTRLESLPLVISAPAKQNFFSGRNKTGRQCLALKKYI